LELLLLFRFLFLAGLLLLLSGILCRLLFNMLWLSLITNWLWILWVVFIIFLIFSFHLLISLLFFRYIRVTARINLLLLLLWLSRKSFTWIIIVLLRVCFFWIFIALTLKLSWIISIILILLSFSFSTAHFFDSIWVFFCFYQSNFLFSFAVIV